MMRSIARVRRFFNRKPSLSGSTFRPSRSFCQGKPPSGNKEGDGGGGDALASTSFSLSTYEDQYKALGKLDFMTATRILFPEQPKKKKFGWDFHMVQLFFACLPSLAVYLVAKYARNKMNKMDAELEKRKQAEFEAQAKEMERKAAEQETAVASNPAIMEVKERLDRLEVALKEIVEESWKQPSKQLNQEAQMESKNVLTPVNQGTAAKSSNLQAEKK